MILRSLLIVLFVSASILVYPQLPDSARVNTIKLDLTSQLFFQKAFVVSYERVVKRNQSFAISLGPQSFPKLLDMGDNIHVRKDGSQSGFKIGGEYRFYLRKENKYMAPRGVYIGPYASFLTFDNTRSLTITTDNGSTQNVDLKSSLDITNIGVQLGYQFVLNNRWSIDLIFIGPSISRYTINLDLDGDLDVDEEQDYQNEILQKLIDKFPFMEDLIQDKTVTLDGKADSWSAGYRYQFLVGYHFGRKKKQ